MKAMDEMWPFLPEVRLFHSRRKCDRFVRKRLGEAPTFMGTGGQTWYGDGVAVVLIEHRGRRGTETALLAHEAYHVVSMHYDEYLGEESPGDEFMAYGVQLVLKALMGAHEKWRDGRGHGGEK